MPLTLFQMYLYSASLLLLSNVVPQSFAEKTVSHGLPRLSPFNNPYQPHQRYPAAPHPSYRGPHEYNPYLPHRLPINQHQPIHTSHDPNIISDRYVSPLRHGSEYSKSAPSVVTFRSPGISSSEIAEHKPQQKSPSSPTKDKASEPPVHETTPVIVHPEHTPIIHVDQDTENYNFGYAVKDDLRGDDFSHQVENNGQRTKGEYRVALPDGRVQIVTYFADEDGYHAEVNYQDSPDDNIRPVPRPSAPVVLVKKPPRGRLHNNPVKSLFHPPGHLPTPHHANPHRLIARPTPGYVLARKNQLKETYSKLAPILHSTPFPIQHNAVVKSLPHTPHTSPHSHNNLQPQKHPSPHGHSIRHHELVPTSPHSPISYSTTTPTPTKFNPTPTPYALPVHIAAYHSTPHPVVSSLSVQDRRANPFLQSSPSPQRATTLSPLVPEVSTLLPAYHPNYKHPAPVIYTTPSPQIRHHSSPFPHFTPAPRHHLASPLSQEPRFIQELSTPERHPTKLPISLPEVHSTFSPKVIHHSSPAPSYSSAISPSNHSPTPIPTFRPTPALTHVLTPTHRYIPSPTPVYAPSPSYVPSPTPKYVPSPTPKYFSTPRYVPSPTPKYFPNPTPKYVPSPTPRYVSSPTPKYVPSPTPRYVLAPTQKYVPSTAPKYTQSPTPKYIPSPTPKAFSKHPTPSGFLYTNPKSVIKSSSPFPICYPPPCSVHPSSPTPIFHPKPHHRSNPTSPIPHINVSSSIRPISQSTLSPKHLLDNPPINHSTSSPSVIHHHVPSASPIQFSTAAPIAYHSTPIPILKSPSPTPTYHSAIKYTETLDKEESEPKVPKPR